MEISCFPRSFSIIPSKVQGANGEQVAVMRITVLDVGGTVLHVVFGAEDWPQFVEACADPAAAQARAEARSKIVAAGGFATLKERKH